MRRAIVLYEPVQHLFKATESVKIDMFKIDIIALSESRRIQLQFATNEDSACQRGATSLRWAYDVT